MSLYPVYNDVFNSCACGGKPPKHEDDKEKHPHGIYRDAGYHHQNSRGPKSQCPKDGQKVLDSSLEAGSQRVGIEGDSFIVLKKTCEREFHGYVVTWEELTPAMQKALRNNGLVRGSGKIIRQIITRK